MATTFEPTATATTSTLATMTATASTLATMTATTPTHISATSVAAATAVTTRHAPIMPTDSGGVPSPTPSWPTESAPTVDGAGTSGDEALFYQTLIVFALLASLVAALLFYCLARVRRAEFRRSNTRPQSRRNEPPV